MSTTPTTTASPTEKPRAVIPSAEALAAYAELDLHLPTFIVQAAVSHERNAFIYALTGLIIGGLLSCGLIAGFVYLVMKGHPIAAGSLLGAGALSLIAGFLSSRLHGREHGDQG